MNPLLYSMVNIRKI